jgi:hypothetical protein
MLKGLRARKNPLAAQAGRGQKFLMSGNKKPTKINGGLKTHLGRLEEQAKLWRL